MRLPAIKINRLLCFFLSFGSYYLFDDSSLSAQIIPDGTVNTQVNQVNGVTEITGGTAANNNLFHSFQDFSLESGNTALFNQDLNISNIITRVTGTNISNIDGLIKANGNANLIFINPNGINFAKGARIDIGGSFLASTADRIIFADGTVYNSRDLKLNPLLTVSVPLGLQIGQNSGAINVSGTGHNLTLREPLFSPNEFGAPSGMQVKPGRTLALVGGKITFDGGSIAAPGGKIELGSVAVGEVNLNFSDNNLSLGYQDRTVLDNIQMRSLSLADASGTESLAAGSIQVQANQLSLDDGSILLVQNRADQTAGNIVINATDAVAVNGTNADGTFRTSIINETIGRGRGGDLQITTKKLSLDQGAKIAAKTISPGTGNGGNIIINATDSVEVIGFSAINPSVTSTIIAGSFGVGNGGNNTITTKVLNARSGGTVVASPFNVGNGGDLQIKAEDINLTGIAPTVFAPSALTAATFGSGNAGNLTIDTARLTVKSGARVDSSTGAAGNAGSIRINASDVITVSDSVPNSINPSLIASSANVVDPALQQLLRLPPTPSGNAGNLDIVAKELRVTNEGKVSVVNDGTGDGGELKIDAKTIVLNNQGSISAATKSGIGGNITLTGDNFFLKGQSTTTATAEGEGNGGNITISGNNLIALEESKITANANQGAGGNIKITSRGIYSICDECQITASSGVGFDGVINIETLQPNSQLKIIDLPQQPRQAGETVTVGCRDTRQANLSQLAVIGRGGLPPRPLGVLSSKSLFDFNKPDSSSKSATSATNSVDQLPPPARGWYQDHQGKVVLSAFAPMSGVAHPAIAPINCHNLKSEQ
ncbi:filamentous hemagglutinin-like protein [Chondrocystis sp. NIES-4102]|nr:filamentous hemagglutinin-like protein [Chondrocystis sp. NIES-4102]